MDKKKKKVTVFGVGGLLLIGVKQEKYLEKPYVLQAHGNTVNFLKLVGQPEKVYLENVFLSYYPDEQILTKYLEISSQNILKYLHKIS